MKKATVSTAKTATSATTKSTRKSTRTTPEVKVSNQLPTYEQIQRLLMDKDTMEERSLQQRVKSNLRSLKQTIETNIDEIEKAEDAYAQALQSSNVVWSNVVALGNKVDNLKAGLDELRKLRNTRFPNWESILIAD